MQNRSLYLCRHGQRIDAIRPKWYGEHDNRHDPHLSDQGVQQAQRLADRLRGEPIEYLYCSPYVRALQTAAPIAEALILPIRVEPGLGEWQSRYLMSQAPEIQMAAERYESFPQIDLDYLPFKFPSYPESEKDVRHRLLRTVQHLLVTTNGNLLLVGHGKMVSGLTTQLAGVPENQLKHDPAALTHLVYENEQWHIHLNGDTAHLTESA